MIKTAFETVPCESIHNIVAYDDGRPVGKAILFKGARQVIVDKDEAVLLDLLTYHDKDRGKGIGKMLVKTAQSMNKIIVTSVLGAAGKKVCLKCGFKVAAKSKLGMQLLIWEKNGTGK